MSIIDNTNTLRLILSEINALPDRNADIGGGSVQTASGTFTAPGSFNGITIECGFTPDIIVIRLPDSYTYYGTPVQNSIAVDMTNVTLNTGTAQGVGIYGVEDTNMDLTFVAFFSHKFEDGFSVYMVYEQDVFNAEWWYSTKTYEYTAIKFNGEAPEQGNGWTSGVPYDHLTSLVANCYIESNGVQTAYNGWSATDYLPCDGVEDIVIDFKYRDYEEYESKNYNAFYDENKQFIRSFSFASNRTSETVSICEYNNMVIPANAKYVRFSHVSERMQQMFIFTPIG